MWFKNLYLYRLPKNWAVDAAQIEDQLAKLTLQGCNATCLLYTSPSPRD